MVYSESVGDSSGVVQVQFLRTETQEEHIFLNPGESASYDASEINGMMFSSMIVLLNSTNKTFLQTLLSDLYIQSYEYFGNLGAWTPNTKFTLTNPTSTREELFVKIEKNYLQTTYASDLTEGDLHTIEFTSGPASDRVFVRWDMFASLQTVEANYTAIDVTSLNPTQIPIKVEFLPTYMSFHLPDRQRIQSTHFKIRLQEKNSPWPSSFCYISAIKLEHKDVILFPNEEFTFDVPDVTGWNYLTTVVYTNLTTTLYPQPYPFQVLDLAVWEPAANPMLATAVDTSFGIKNLSNQTYTLGFDVVYYYWQNQMGLAFQHEIVDSNEVAITHKVIASVSDAEVGADLGLSGQFLRFLVSGKTLQFAAPNPVGIYEDSYIPLRQGLYELVKQEERVAVNITTQPDEVGLANRLHFSVTYNGEPLGGAAVSVMQRGTFTSQTYNATTDINGEATIAVHSSLPEGDQLEIRVAKDEFNYRDATLDYFVGWPWIALAVLIVAVIVGVAGFMIWKRKIKL